MTAASSQTVTSGRPAAARAARKAHEKNSVRLSLPVVGDVELPPPDEIAFLAGVGVLAVLEVIEWPVALVLVLGHAAASSHRNRLVREFGEALETA